MPGLIAQLTRLLCALLLLAPLVVDANTCAPVEQALLKPVPNPKWAVVALTKPGGKHDLTARNNALARILKPYAQSHDITAIFFSEFTFPDDIVSKTTKEWKGVAQVKFVNTADRGFHGKERFGYKYMCKFFSIDIYDYLRGYDYYMRVDSDCTVRTADFDILKWAEDANVGYGFAMRKIEAHGPTKQKMPVWVGKYAESCDVKPTAIMDEPLSTCFNFYNNWHIGRVEFFNRPDVRHFLTAVNASGHILADRWGDSTIQAYAVRLFMDPKQIIQVPNFAYVHGSHSKVVSTFGDGSDTNVPQRLPNWVAPK